jgi:hypothetical protein
MKRLAFIGLLVALLLSFSAFSAHKFYVAIFQVNYAPEKKMLQITSRIFVDDLNNALEKKHKRKFHLGEKEEMLEDVALMQKYLLENFTIKVSGKPKQMTYLSNEMENNVLICYYKISDITKISSLEIHNKVLFDYVTEQQNIIQMNVRGKKSNLLLTPENPSGTLTY